MPLTHVILDLDNTIICSKYTNEVFSEKDKERTKGIEMFVMEDYYDIYERPGLQTFLDYLLIILK